MKPGNYSEWLINLHKTIGVMTDVGLDLEVNQIAIRIIRMDLGCTFNLGWWNFTDKRFGLFFGL